MTELELPEYLAAVDIGGTKITVSIANRKGFLVKVYQPTKVEGDIRTIPQQVEELLARCCREISIPENNIAVGVSTCSPFELRDQYRVLVAPNLCGVEGKNDWPCIHLEEELVRRYASVTIDNDCIAAVVAERLFGAGKRIDNVVEGNVAYITWSTGIGAGICVDGRVLRGKNGNAGHFGHIFLAEEGQRCNCGNSGDLESLASGKSIAREYGAGASTEDVFDAYRQGDPRAQKIIERAVYNVARGMASLVSLLDTKVVILGGSVIRNNTDLLPKLKEEFYASFPPLTRGVQITLSGLGDYLGDMAAASLVMPESWIEEWRADEPWKHSPEPIVLKS